ncbi:TIR domain-containing protein [Rubrobacter marinus]|uniref:TIR domain-containing protein n=1 Tax=Rubrobacter marinus TaxID=2653852 RepID=UPI003899BBEE
MAKRGIRVFYDEREKVQLWGKDLYAHLDDIYQNLAQHCVLFASTDYAEKVWTNHERRSAQARAIKEQGDYLLPARFDHTPIPGLPDTVGYVDLRGTSPAELVDLIEQKLGPREKEEFFPPIPDLLYQRLGIENDSDAQQIALEHAHHWFNVLRRMTQVEREVIGLAFVHGCPEELPDNMHIYVDLLRRVTGLPPAKLKRVLGGLNSLGFTCTIREDHEDAFERSAQLGQAPLFQIEWVDLVGNEFEYPEMLVATETIFGAVDGCCEACGVGAIRRLDFSHLASATVSEEHS